MQNLKRFLLGLAVILVSRFAMAATPPPAITKTKSPTTAPTTRPTTRGVVHPPRLFGVSLCGAEFGESDLPGIYGRHYTYPPAQHLDYYKSHDIRLVRLPFRWERLQRALFDPLDLTELARIDAFIAECRQRGMQVILDPHNYARYNGKLIGSPEVPNEAFADFWSRVAEHYRDETAIYAYGLVNEPHDTKGLWPAAAQAGVDGVRRQDRKHFILVPGDNWSSAKDWRKWNENLSINDPGDRMVYEAHLYFDPDSKGTYEDDYDEALAHPTLGVDRIKPFVEWLRDHGHAGFVGEYGIPGDDDRWLPVLDKSLEYLQANDIGGCYWAGGPWWKDYILSLEPREGTDRPQMKVLKKYR